MSPHHRVVDLPTVGNLSWGLLPRFLHPFASSDALLAKPMHHDLPPPKLVQDAQGLDQLLADLATQSEIAVDTEADSFFSYREKVCLVQVSVEDRDYLVDPLAGVDLAPLGPVLADPDKTKIFHDGEYDVLILKRDYGFSFAGLFDTRVAAAALGTSTPGLASVLKDRFQVELDKSLQRSDWSERPLSDKQIAYARLDTRFLIPLMREQRKELIDKRRTMIVDGECRRLEQLEASELRFNPDEFIRIKGARNLSPIQRQVLRELFSMREELAERRNVPPFRVMSQKVLLDLAQARPRNKQELQDKSGLTWKQVRRFGEEVLAAFQSAEELGPLRQLPSLPRKDGTSGLEEEDLELHERLKGWRKTRGQKEGIDSSLVLNRHVLLRLALARPATPADLEGIEGLLPWQIEMFGSELLQVTERFEKDLRSGLLAKNGSKRYRRKN